MDRVLALSDRLRKEGIDCCIDQYEQSPPEGWPRWCERRVEESEFVLVACTQAYLRRFKGDEALGIGLGGTWEGHIITQELFNFQGKNNKFIPIIFLKQDAVCVPVILQGAIRYEVPDEYELLYRRLTNQPLVMMPPLGSVRPMPAREYFPSLPKLERTGGVRAERLLKGVGTRLTEVREKISIDSAISSRIIAAWGKLTEVQQRQVAPLILSAHQQVVTTTQTGKAKQRTHAPQCLLLARSVLSNDSEGVIANTDKNVVIDVGADGLIWGTGKYQALDPGWTEAFAVYLENLAPVLGGRHAFVADPQIIPIPDDVQIGLAGDWGTGNWRQAANPAPGARVGSCMEFLRPDLTIHLGNVYYAGTSDREQQFLVKLWPNGLIGSLALNSNYEMCSGAKPYFAAISNPPFAMQQGCSYFVLENSNWIIAGLDSAYFSREEGLYMDGSLGPNNGPQVKFLQAQVAKGKKAIVLTRHNGLSEDGSSTTNLWTQVMSAFPESSGPAYWYWGHVHAGVVYQPKLPAYTLCRCIGHGALPWGMASELGGNPNVLWYENRSARDVDIPMRVLNGFAMLHLDGPNIVEVLYDENGGVAWP
jgi:hypothetical protein